MQVLITSLGALMCFLWDGSKESVLRAIDSLSLPYLLALTITPVMNKTMMLTTLRYSAAKNGLVSDLDGLITAV